jgi:hypothetical protein
MQLVVVVLIAGVIFIGGSGVLDNKKSTQTSGVVNTFKDGGITPSPTEEAKPTLTGVPSPKITPVPLVDCLGPDGKKIKLSKKACDEYKKSWGIVDPTITPTPKPVVCNTSTDLGNLTVSIQPESGQSLVGDGYALLSNGSGSCAGYDSRLPYGQVISQGSMSVKFPGYRPAKFHVKVTYHGKNYETDVDINPGENSVNFTVSN